MKKTDYKTPTLKVVEFKIESGFAASSPGFADQFQNSTDLMLIFDDDLDLQTINKGNEFGDDFWN